MGIFVVAHHVELSSNVPFQRRCYQAHQRVFGRQWEMPSELTVSANGIVGVRNQRRDHVSHFNVPLEAVSPHVLPSRGSISLT